jgi:nicotinate-nucleotide adenylyltransferase
MLRLALAGAPQFEVSTVDLDRAGPSYTSELLALLADRLAPATLVFLMGEDSLRDLPHWHEPDRIVALAELGVARRPTVDFKREEVFQAVPAARQRIQIVPVPLIDISSAMIRARIAANRPYEYFLPSAVAHYIRAHGLYRS